MFEQPKTKIQIGALFGCISDSIQPLAVHSHQLLCVQPNDSGKRNTAKSCTEYSQYICSVAGEIWGLKTYLRMSKFVQINFTFFLKQKSTTFISTTSLHVNLELTLIPKYQCSNVKNKFYRLVTMSFKAVLVVQFTTQFLSE